MSRLRPRISLRMFLLAATALIVLLGGLIYRVQRQHEAIAELGNAIVIWDYQAPADGASWNPEAGAPGPEWSAGPWGEGLFSSVWGVIAVDELSPRGMASLAVLADLEYLNLANANVDDEALAVLARLRNLKTLNLQMTRVTDAGMPRLAELESLEALWLNYTDVTDAGAAQLEALPRLRILHVEETAVTEAAVERLKERLPNCQIWWGPTSSPQQGPEAAAVPRQ